MVTDFRCSVFVKKTVLSKRGGERGLVLFILYALRGRNLESCEPCKGNFQVGQELTEITSQRWRRKKISIEKSSAMW